MKMHPYTAILLAGAVGDTLGMPVECWKPVDIKEYLGRVIAPLPPQKILPKDTPAWFTHLEKGDITDDTLLTVAIAESIIEKNGLDLTDCMNRQVDAYFANPIIDGKSIYGFGGSTVKAFENWKQGNTMLAVPPGLGNGVAMKVAALGIYAHATRKYVEALQFAGDIGTLTHTDPRAIAAGVVQSHAVYALLSGYDKQQFLDSLVEVCMEYEYPLKDNHLQTERGSLLDKIEWISANQNVDEQIAYRALGNSCNAFESVPFTWFMVQKYWDAPLEGLIVTVNWGGDADSTGAMYASLAAARHGIFFPNEWIDMLKIKDKILDVSQKLSELH